MNKLSLRYIILFYCLFLFLTAAAAQAAPSPDGNSPSACWTMDQTDFNDYYFDSIGSYIAQPANEPNFVTAVFEEPNGAVLIDTNFGLAESQIFSFDTADGFSICLWADWKGNWQQTVDINDLVVESNDLETEYKIPYGLKADQRWQHICVTYDNSTVRIYLNGKLKLSESGQFTDGSEAVIEIGNSLREQIFNGSVDDIRLYNYPLSQTEINQLATGDSGCSGPYAIEFDFTGQFGVPDCVVDQYDLAEFVNYWLDELSPYNMDYDFTGPGGLPDGEINFYDLTVFAASWLSNGWQ